MGYDLYENLNCIYKMANEVFIDEAFNSLYPFTTENISGYINHFDLKNKSLLTVGSSGDQIINAILKGCKDITLFDINKYAKYYYYLKVSAIIELNKEEFLYFLKYIDHPKVFKNNYKVLSKKTFEKIKPTLRLLDYESYLFWDDILSNFNSSDIRSSGLFELDEDRTDIIRKSNLYLKNNINFKNTKDLLKKVNPTFIKGNLFKDKPLKSYDNIWLSNIGQYLAKEQIKTMVDIMNNYLNIDGIMLISYLYETTADTPYKACWAPIYDLKFLKEELKEYDPYFITFKGIKGIKFNDSKFKDSALIYKKKGNKYE